MVTVTKPLAAYLAADLMSRDLLLISDSIPLRAAAHMLLRHDIHGAPVVDGNGRLVGVVSSADFVRMVDRRATAPVARDDQPASCPFQVRTVETCGEEVVLCELPPGMCPVQQRLTDADGHERLVCSQPHSVFADWQVVLVNSLPTDAVKNFMMRDPVIVVPTTPICELSRRLLHSHADRAIVVDAERKPVGIVTSTDILAALVRTTGSQIGEAECDPAEADRYHG